MKKLILLVLMLSAFAQAQISALKQRERELMSQVYMSVREMPTITTIDSPAILDRNMEAYLQTKKWFERDYAELCKVNPDIDSSLDLIGGVPFYEILKRGRELIARNDAFIASAESKKPKAEALDAISHAFLMGTIGTRQLELPEQQRQSFETLSEIYEAYLTSKEEASKLDPRVLEYRKDEIASYEKSFVEPFLKLRQKQDMEAGQKQAAIEAEQQRQAAERQQKEIERRQQFQKKTDYAKKMGFRNGAYTGISLFVEELENEYIELNEASSYLIYPLSEDYIMQSLDSTFVFFMDDSGDALKQIALIREPDKIYPQESCLPDGTYQFIKFGDFTTVMGAGIQVPIFRRYKD